MRGRHNADGFLARVSKVMRGPGGRPLAAGESYRAHLDAVRAAVSRGTVDRYWPWSSHYECAVVGPCLEGAVGDVVVLPVDDVRRLMRSRSVEVRRVADAPSVEDADKAADAAIAALDAPGDDSGAEGAADDADAAEGESAPVERKPPAMPKVTPGRRRKPRRKVGGE